MFNDCLQLLQALQNTVTKNAVYAITRYYVLTESKWGSEEIKIMEGWIIIALCMAVTACYGSLVWLVTRQH